MKNVLTKSNLLPILLLLFIISCSEKNRTNEKRLSVNYPFIEKKTVYVINDSLRVQLDKVLTKHDIKYNLGFESKKMYPIPFDREVQDYVPILQPRLNKLFEKAYYPKQDSSFVIKYDYGTSHVEWNYLYKVRKNKIYLDEIWRLIGVTSNKDVASFIYKIFKTIRKYGGSAVAITQDISDLFSLEDGTYGKSILNNSEIKTFFALEEENIKVLEKYTNLSEKEKIEIKSLKRGECLMFIGAEHILTKIESADFEKEIIEPNKERNLL